MNEFRRIFCSRTYIASLIILLLISAVTYIYNTAGNDMPIQTDIGYVTKYNDFFDKISREAETLKKLEVFKDENSFSYKKILQKPPRTLNQLKIGR